MLFQETEFLDTAVKRILAAAPDVCVIERSASLHVVELLQKANVTLVYNVPMTDMTSLAISTNTKVSETLLDALSTSLCVTDRREHS